MAKAKISFDDLLAIGTRAELRAIIAASRISLSLNEAQSLVARIQTFEPPAHTLRLAIAHSYTSELLDPWLLLAAALQGVDLHTYHAPYGMTVQLADENSAFVKHKPDITLLMLQREDLHPDLDKPLAGFSTAGLETLRAEILERLGNMVGKIRQHKVGQIVLTLLPAFQGPGLGLYDAQSERSETAWWARLKAAIGNLLRDSIQASLFLDLDEALKQLGRNSFFDHRLCTPPAFRSSPRPRAKLPGTLWTWVWF